MSQKSCTPPTRVPAEKLVRDISRATRKHHSAEDKNATPAASFAEWIIMGVSVAGASGGMHGLRKEKPAEGVGQAGGSWAQRLADLGIDGEVLGEFRQSEQALEMPERAGKVEPFIPPEHRREARGRQHLHRAPFMRQLADVTGEADIGQRQFWADDARRLRRQRPLDAAEMAGRRAPRVFVGVHVQLPSAEAQQIALHVVREGQAFVQEAVNARSLERPRPEERAPPHTEPRHQPHDAVGLEHADRAIRAEGGGHGAEGIRLQESLSLVEGAAAEAPLAGLGAALRIIPGQWPGVEIPEPGFQLCGRAAAQLDGHVAEPPGNGRLRHPRIGQIREYPEVAWSHDAPLALAGC